MKTRIFTIFIALCLLLLPLFPKRREPFALSARADDPPAPASYACILHEDTFFYATADESKGLFLLPVTYYVKLLEYGESYCRVEYLYDDSGVKKVTGFVKTSLLTFVDYIPKIPYYYYSFSLSYRIEEPVSGNADFLDEITVNCTYYGDYKVGSKTYCYVLRGESFGYVPKPAGFTVLENVEYAEYQASLAPPKQEESSPPEDKQSSPAQIAILIALCLLVPVLAALILKPPRRPPYDVE